MDEFFALDSTVVILKRIYSIDQFCNSMFAMELNKNSNELKPDIEILKSARMKKKTDTSKF